MAPAFGPLDPTTEDAIFIGTIDPTKPIACTCDRAPS
jgi:hypothetical protein